MENEKLPKCTIKELVDMFNKLAKEYNIGFITQLEIRPFQSPDKVAYIYKP